MFSPFGDHSMFINIMPASLRPSAHGHNNKRMTLSDFCRAFRGSMCKLQALPILLTLQLFISTSWGASDARKIFANTSGSVVLIRTFDAAGVPEAIGSGFFIDGNRLVTNAHVIAGAARIEYAIRGSGFVEVAQIAGFDRKRDLAVLV